MTIYALSTGPGVSGVAIIRISGPDTLKVIKLLTNNAVSLFNSWLKNKAVADIFEKYDALVKNSRLGVDRFNDLDLIVDTALLDKIAKENRHIRIYNPILEFVMFARRMSLDTNRMSS